MNSPCTPAEELGQVYVLTGTIICHSIKDALLAAFHDLIGTGVVGIAALYNFIAQQVVLHIGVGQIVMESRADVLGVCVGVQPGRIAVQHIALGVLGHIAVLCYIALELLGHILTVQAHLGEPAEVVQTKVVHFQIMTVALQNLGHVALDGNRHIADVQDTSLRAQTEGCLCHDGSGVGVVDDPVGGLCVLLAVIDQLHHGVDGTQTVSQTARAAGLLTHNAVLQRDFLVLLTHSVQADTHLCKDEICIGHGNFRVGGQGQLQFRVEHFHHMADDDTHSLLTLCVVIVEHQLIQLEAILLHQQALTMPGV